MSNTAPSVPANSALGSDGRVHHNFGFSFAAVLAKCPAARRRVKAAKNLAQAGERGTELHGVLEKLALDWAVNYQVGKPLTLLETFERNTGAGSYKGTPAADMRSLEKVVTEINPFFNPEPGMLLGTEEMIELHDADGEVLSSGWYDLFLKLGKTVLVIDHKFVRKEVDDAEENRQGHCLAVSVWQGYQDVEDVIVLFTMPECGSSMHTFSRTLDEQRLTAELTEIFTKAERPFKTLHAGDHCVLCQFCGDCEAHTSALQTAVTVINPMAVPSNFAPHLIRTPEDMAVLRYWADTLSPIIDAIKEASTEFAKRGQGINCTVNGQYVEYAVQSRSLSRKITCTPLELYEFVKDWMPYEAFLMACKCSITNLEDVVVQLMTDRILAEGGKPNATNIAAAFAAQLTEKGLLEREEGRTYFLKRVKASSKEAKKKKLINVTPGIEDGLEAPIDGQDQAV
jgi:hypothetical protein